MFFSGEVLSVIDMFPMKSQSPLGVSWNPNCFGYKLAVLAFAQSVHNLSAELTSQGQPRGSENLSKLYVGSDRVLYW